MARDFCAFQGPRHRVFQNGQWQLVDTPFEGRTDPPVWLADMGVLNVLNYIIPAHSATRQWQVRGAMSTVDGVWTVRFQCRVGKARGTLFTPTLMEGAVFIGEIDGPTYLKSGEETWVYFKDCAHDPAGDGLPPEAYDALRITVG